MYPDVQHYYDEYDDRDFFCVNIHEQKFMQCLSEYEVKLNDTNNPYYYKCHEQKKERFKKCNEENGAQHILRRHLNRTRPRKCDKINVVYSLTKDESNFLKPYDECSRPFVVQRIAHSNLILLITNRNCAQVFTVERDFEDVPKTIEFENSTFCHKYRRPLFRSRPKSCMTHHEKVSWLNSPSTLFLTFFIIKTGAKVRHKKHGSIAVRPREQTQASQSHYKIFTHHSIAQNVRCNLNLMISV